MKNGFKAQGRGSLNEPPSEKYLAFGFHLVPGMAVTLVGSQTGCRARTRHRIVTGLRLGAQVLPSRQWSQQDRLASHLFVRMAWLITNQGVLISPITADVA